MFKSWVTRETGNDVKLIYVLIAFWQSQYKLKSPLIWNNVLRTIFLNQLPCFLWVKIKLGISAIKTSRALYSKSGLLILGFDSRFFLKQVFVNDDGFKSFEYFSRSRCINSDWWTLNSFSSNYNETKIHKFTYLTTPLPTVF